MICLLNSLLHASLAAISVSKPSRRFDVAHQHARKLQLLGQQHIGKQRRPERLRLGIAQPIFANDPVFRLAQDLIRKILQAFQRQSRQAAAVPFRLKLPHRKPHVAAHRNQLDRPIAD